MDGITPQMARAELARRELARRQQAQPQQDIQQAPQGIGSIPGDIGQAGINLFAAAGDKAMQLPEEFGAAGQQIAEHPLSGTARAGGGVLSSLLEGGKQLYNLPLNINTYLASKGVPIFKQTAPLAEMLKIGDTGLQKAVMGEHKPGDQLWEDIGAVAPLFMAPESITGNIPAVTGKGIMKGLSKAKATELGIAKKEYGQLFGDAANQGLTHANPVKSVTKNQADIIKNSQPKYHTSLKKYLENPTIENAHWAQSELGALERHLDNISKKTGLTPSQIKTLKSVNAARAGIKESMFSKNALGSNPQLAMKYDELAAKYKKNVIPYTSLEDLSEYEAGRLRPNTAVKNLYKDEEFMINLAKKNPGIYLHSPAAKKLGYGVAGASGLLGYEELKKLLQRN